MGASGNKSSYMQIHSQPFYFHVDIDCSGMRAAFPWAIEDAVKDGKLPCPECVGGPNAPDEPEVMTGDFRFSDAE